MDNIPMSGWDVILFGIPLIAFLFFGFFRLDQLFTFRKRENPDAPGPLPYRKRHRKAMRSDPDGRPWDDH